MDNDLTNAVHALKFARDTLNGIYDSLPDGDWEQREADIAMDLITNTLAEIREANP